MDKTIQDYIYKTLKELKKEESEQDRYPVYPEDDGTDLPKNPYAPT
jgi:hypothetical protein